jgi:hypothetical protein
VQVTGTLTANGKTVTFSVAGAAEPPPTRTAPRPLPGFPAASSGTTRQPVSARTAVAAAATSPDPATTTYDPDRSCSVPRNDPKTETYQPSDQQIEWATDEAVQGHLTGNRGPDLYGSGLAAYTPQGMFPLPGLDGGGSIPAQIMLGVLTQESALYQASDHVIIGEAGNYMPSFDWYGDLGNYTFVNWAASDCGYGIAQITTGMCRSGYITGAGNCGNALAASQQEAIAVDYQANIAAGARILEQKWNELYQYGITANSANPQYIEDWYFALWDYNAGLEPNFLNGNTTGCTPGPSCTDSGGNWGLGWANNPANDAYPPDRPSFLNQSSATAPQGGIYDAAWEMSHPQYWPYQEKVIGWAFDAFTNWSFVKGAYVQAYAWGKWPSGTSAPAIAPHTQLCTSANHCNPADVPSGAVSDPANPCQLTGSLANHCWWHWPSSWVTNCAASCGTGVLTYGAGAADPGDPGVPAGYPPACTQPAASQHAIVVGDTASSIPVPLGCGESWSNNGGVMSWQFGSSTDSVGNTTYPSKIDFHQIAAGYGGHFWFTHTIPTAAGNSCTAPQTPNLMVTGTWTPPPSLTGQVRVWASVPNIGAQTSDAAYKIITATGQAPWYVVVNQYLQQDAWIDLGVFNFSAGASVSLTNVSCNGSGNDVAWGAMAFIAQSGPHTGYVAMGDSYSAGVGNAPYEPGTTTGAGRCLRSQNAYPTKVTLPGQSTPIAQQSQFGSGNTSFVNIACNGARTTAIAAEAVDNPPTVYDTNGNTDWGQIWSPLPERLQAQQGHLSSSTTLVTLTIGGNDARFSDVLFGCLTASGDCSAPGFYLKRNSTKATDPNPLGTFERYVITTLLPPHLVAVYTKIHQLAPNAEIIVLGYPQLFPTNTTSTCTVGSILKKPFTLSANDQNWLNQMGGVLNATISSTVSTTASHLGADIRFIDPSSAFNGHALCSADPWFYGLSGQLSVTGGLSVLDPGSFHPNQAGQNEDAALVNGCLADTSTC